MLNFVTVQCSSYVDCVVHCVSCVTIGLIGFVSDKCSFVVAFVDGLFIYGCTFLWFDYLKDEY